MSNSGIHFNISERKVLLRLFDALFIIFFLYIISYWFDFDYFTVTHQNWTWILVLLIYVTVFGTVFELYDLKKANKLETVLSNIVITTTTTVMVYLLTPFFTPELPGNRLQILYFFLAILTALCTWRFLYITFIVSPRFHKNVLIVGEVSNIGTIIDAFKKADPNYNIKGFINCEASRENGLRYRGIQEYDPEQLLEVIVKERISEVVVAAYNSETITPELYHDLINLLETGFPIKEYTQVFEEMTYRVPVQFVGKDFYKYFPFSRSNTNKLYLLYNRVFNLFFSLIGLVFALVLLPFIYLGNLIGNPGSLFYKQERVGKNGETFQIIKFRTMVMDAEANGAVWATVNDSRITPFGKFLRRTRLDELPQFINILKGEMNMIGPRPERPYFVRELSQVIPFYETRHIIRPGITGWAQVNVRYGSTVDDSLLKLQYDLYYIKHRSFFLDLNIIIKTISAVIFFRGQ